MRQQLIHYLVPDRVTKDVPEFSLAMVVLAGD